jgi:hypothetical protein
MYLKNRTPDLPWEYYSSRMRVKEEVQIPNSQNCSLLYSIRFAPAADEFVASREEKNRTMVYPRGPM